MKSKRVAVRNRQIIFSGIIVAAIFILVCSVAFGSVHAQAAPSEESYKYYTSVQVQKGDTLWSIAGSYITDDYKSMDAYLNEICTLNHIAEDTIHAGEYLTIPYYTNDYLE